jgi:hypothetical protein
VTALPARSPEIVPKPLVASVEEIDDLVRIIVNGTLAYEGGPKTSIQAPLTFRSNAIEVQVFNQASYTGGIEMFGGHQREGWRYSLTLQVDGVSQKYTDRRDNQPVEQFGTWFTALRVSVDIDPATGRPDQHGLKRQ